MPQRFLRPGITTSDAWNSVSWQAQSLYIRILTLVDDYGRYDGRLPIIHAHCFALRPDITLQETAGFRSELQTLDLIKIYEVEGKEYLQMSKWQERARGPSKYPDPQGLTEHRSEPQRTAAESCFPSQRPSPSANGHRPEQAAKRSPLDNLELPFDSLEFEKAWEDWKKDRADRRKKLTPKAAEMQLKKLFSMGEERAIACIEQSITNGWTGLFELGSNGHKKPATHVPQEGEQF